MRRRKFIRLMGGAVATWPLAAPAQQPGMPVIGPLAAAPILIDGKRMLAFRQGLGETGYTDGRNVAVEHIRAEGQYDHLPTMAADLVRRQVNVIVTPNSRLELLHELVPDAAVIAALVNPTLSAIG